MKNVSYIRRMKRLKIPIHYMDESYNGEYGDSGVAICRGPSRPTPLGRMISPIEWVSVQTLDKEYVTCKNCLKKM